MGENGGEGSAVREGGKEERVMQEELGDVPRLDDQHERVEVHEC